MVCYQNECIGATNENEPEKKTNTVLNRLRNAGMIINDFKKCVNNSSKIFLKIWYITSGPAVRVFANGPGDLGSIPGRVIPKTLKMELDTTLLNTQHYKVRFKGKVEQSWEWSSALPYTLV